MTTLKVKSGAGGTWEEVGGIGLGVPAGGTTGQVLTKSSAADYATAWTSTPPILANNSYLQGYKADGTTVQSLIGMTTADEITIGPSLAAGKNIYVPRLTVQGNLTLGSAASALQSDTGSLFLFESAGRVYVAHNRNVDFNLESGDAFFRRNVTVDGTLGVVGALYKPGIGNYTFPDFVFEHAFTGGIERFRDAPGAQEYEGLWPLDLVEEYAREHWRLPHHAPREDDRVDVFRRTHDMLAELERLYLHMFDHEKRLAALEGR